MSSRSKRTSKANDIEENVCKEDGNSIKKHIGKRRSLRNAAGPATEVSICKKAAPIPAKPKQAEKITNNSVNEGLSKNRSGRSTRNSSPRKCQVANTVLNSSPKQPPVEERMPVRISPRSAANGTVESNPRRNPRRNRKNTDDTSDTIAKISEQIKVSPPKKKTRSSNRKRLLSPNSDTDSPQASDIVKQPSKRQCQSKRGEKIEPNSHENGDVPKANVVPTTPVAISKLHPDSCHTPKMSAKRPLHFDPDANIYSPRSKKMRAHTSPVKQIEESSSELIEESVAKQLKESPPKSSGENLMKEEKSSPAKLKEESSLEKMDKLVNSTHNGDAISANISITSNQASTDVNLDETEDIISTDSALGRLFEACKLNDSQRKELLSILPKNCIGLTQEELVEVIVKLLLETGATLKSMTSPRFNKFLRNLLNIHCTSKVSVDKKHWLCENALKWAKDRKTVNLTHELELALMHLYYNTEFYKKAERTATVLYAETKKLQDKEKIVQACLCLSQTYHAMGNISKARANITTAKTEALKIYTAPDLQAELDLQSGIMQIAEEKDMETAYSYFKEASTGFTIREKRSRALKYMLLSKLLVNRPEEGEKLVQTQTHVLDIDEGVEALIAVTKAAISSSLEEFKNALDRYNAELKEDLVVKDVIDKLYSKMLEKNLINIIMPYEKIQISYVANRIGLDHDDVERRLSQLILDGQVKAQLDHRDGCLYVYQSEMADRVYPMAIDTMAQLDRTITHLNKRVKQLLL